MVGEVEGEYPPLPDDYTFNYSASGGGDEPDGDNDDDDLKIDLTDKQVSKYNFLNVWPIIWMDIVLPIAIARLLS